MFKFLSKIGKQKVKSAGQSITEAIVRFDPEAATEAAIEMMDEHVDSLSLEAAKMRQEYEREQQEADTIKATYNKRIDAANHIQSQIDAAKTKKESEKLNNSLNTLLDSIEEMQPDVQREVDEANDAKQVLGQLESALEMAVGKLKTARSDHKKAKNEMKKAEFQRKNAEANEKRQSMLAGITSESDSLSTAINTMKSVAQDDLAKADAANRKAKLLQTSDITDDQTIAEAMNSVSGVMDEPESSPDRLSRLSKM